MKTKQSKNRHFYKESWAQANYMIVVPERWHYDEVCDCICDVGRCREILASGQVITRLPAHWSPHNFSSLCDETLRSIVVVNITPTLFHEVSDLVSCKLTRLLPKFVYTWGETSFADVRVQSSFNISSVEYCCCGNMLLEMFVNACDDMPLEVLVTAAILFPTIFCLQQDAFTIT